MPSPTMDQSAHNERLLERRQVLTAALESLPYDPILYLERAAMYSDLGYPDLAASDAYRALLLTDEIANDGFEYHEPALESLQQYSGEALPDVLNHGELDREEPMAADDGDPQDARVALRRLAHLAKIRAYQILSLSLLLCGCLKSASTFCDQGLAVAPENRELLNTRHHVDKVARQRLRRPVFDVDDLPDDGLVRREIYPWNKHEPDRFSPESLEALNADMKKLAPKCAVRVASLPVLLEGPSVTDGYEIIPTCRQLGVFATEDIGPGEVVIKEYSLLTASNRLKEAVCDACRSELAPLGSENGPVECQDCFDTIFCGQRCHDEAQERYHPAVCQKDLDFIAKDPGASETDETLRLLLLARVLALAEHQGTHPLRVREVRFIWGDFVPSRANEINVSPEAGPPPKWTLPFSFKYNIEMPLHVLEKMDIDIYARLAEYDLWVLNTLHAKFRSTASARKNPRNGRPDVAAVHPIWGLTNHDCDPNVAWQWGGTMVLSARRERIVGGRPGGIKRGEEILNSYCDVTLPVQERREWARGSLGGWCMCRRCRSESAEDDTPKRKPSQVGV